jgi:transposase
MPAVRLSMRKIREVLRLKWGLGLSNRQVSLSCQLGREAISQYLQRAKRAGLSWPLPNELGDAALEQLLFPPVALSSLRPMPHWADVHKDLKSHKHLSLFLCWEEYKSQHPEGYQYTRFCQLYRKWTAKLDVVMRQEHRAGEKLFVDYAGQTVSITDPSTGKIRQAEIFVAVLGASNYTFAEATWTQSLPDWIGSHVRSFEYFQGVPEIIVPDNLKAAVSCAHRYEPDLNPTYQEMASHYGVAVIPARSRKPRDKAKVEAGVLVVERWILARLRKRIFFSLTQLNAAIAQLLAQLNERDFKKLPGSRKSVFESLEKPALSALPSEAYKYAQWRKARVNIDYHIEVHRHYYSVPYQLCKQELDIRLSAKTIECFYKGKRVASHVRSDSTGRHTTLKAHMPLSHRQYADFTPERMIRWAQKSGEHTAKLVETMLHARAHPQQGFRSVLGILRLGKRYSAERLEAACKRALILQSTTYKSVSSILKTGLDQRPLLETAPTTLLPNHSHIRGCDYYGNFTQTQNTIKGAHNAC